MFIPRKIFPTFANASISKARDITAGSGIRWLLMSIIALLLTACQQQSPNDVTLVADADTRVLQVLKSPTCGCCELWVDHANERGFVTQISHPEDLTREKLQLGIWPQLQSCHTAISEEGYVFEGHIPANLIHRFLDQMPNDALGLAVPGMPLGSPGMELGSQFQPYDVLLIKADGSTEVYEHIGTQAEQY
jgi:hypothetical protein